MEEITKRVILFVTHGQISDNGNQILLELTKFGKVIALVDQEQLHPIGWVDYMRLPNKGRDFGKIYNFLNKYKQPFEEIVYTNDTISIIDHFDSLFQRWEAHPELDFGGATSAYSHDCGLDIGGYHIQSFWHMFRGKGIDILKGLYYKNGIIEDKFDGVKCYETGFTQTMMGYGCKCGAMIECYDIMARHGLGREDVELSQMGINQLDSKGDFNGTFQYPLLYIKEGLPFVKNSCFQYHHYDPNLLPYLANKCLRE